MRSTNLGAVEVRSIPGKPSRFEGMALPFGVTITVGYGKERFTRGAFTEAAAEVRSGTRLAYLNRHGPEGGVPVGVIDTLHERADGLWFAGEWMQKPEAVASQDEIARGIDGVSVEFVPGKFRTRGDAVEHYQGVRLAAIAGSYAPAYRTARVALRSVAGAAERGRLVFTTAALTERRAALTTQIATIRGVAETESRSLNDDETQEIATLDGRIANVDALITQSQQDTQRRDAERTALPAQRVGSVQGNPAAIETVYGPRTGQSYFRDLFNAGKGDSEAARRLSQHQAHVVDIARRLETRATDTGDLGGVAMVAQTFPNLYVPDLTYSGPLSGFFQSIPITAPNPIIVPAFASVTGDTGPQGAENDPLPNIEVTTAPLPTITPTTVGGESIVSRQTVDSAQPGTDVIIGNQLREMLMRDKERAIAVVLEGLTSSGSILDTAGTTPAKSGQDLVRGIAGKLSAFYAGAAAGGAGARFLPAERWFTNVTDWNNLVAGEDNNGRPLMPFINPVNSQGEVMGVGFQRGIIGGVPVEPAWAILTATNHIAARASDAAQWQSAVLDLRLMEREGPQSVVFAVWQYYAFAVLQSKGVRRYTYTNVLE